MRESAASSVVFVVQRLPAGHGRRSFGQLMQQLAGDNDAHYEGSACDDIHCYHSAGKSAPMGDVSQIFGPFGAMP